MAISVYFHIPFCISKCGYCDFVSYPFHNGQDLWLYDLLLCELDYRSEFISQGVSTLYFGGGSPLLIGLAQIQKLINRIKLISKTQVPPTEVTLEVNFEDLNSNIVDQLLELDGLTRISIGVQSLSLEIRKLIARSRQLTCSIEQLLKEVNRLARRYELSVDLIIGVPGQRNLKQELKIFAEAGVNHFSTYGLSLSDSAAAWNNFRESGFEFPDDQRYLEDLKIIEQVLESRNYNRYEISNWSIPKSESRHNLNYWNLGDYLGLGPGSAGFIERRHYQNPSSLEVYSVQPGISGVNISPELSAEELFDESVMVKMRLFRWLNLTALSRKFNCRLKSRRLLKNLQKYIKNGLIFQKADRIKLSKKGALWLDEVLAEVLF